MRKITVMLGYNFIKIEPAALILALALTSGQLIKLPLAGGGGLTILDVAVLILCAIGLFKLKFKLSKPPAFLTSALLFIFIALFSLVLTPLHLQLSEYLTSSLYIIRFAVYILLGWEIYSGAYPALKNKIPLIFIYSGLGLAVLGLLQLIFLPDLRFLTAQGWDPHYFRTVAFFLDPNFLGAYLVLILLLLSSHLGGGLARTPGVFYLIFALIYFALLTTFSRGAYLAFLTGFLTLSFLKKSLKLGILAVILFLILLFGFFAYQKVVAEPKGVNRTESAQFRFNTWQQGWKLFSLHPVLGVGFNAYKVALKEYKLADERFLSSHGSSTNDSSLLYIASTTGIIGAAGFLFFLFTLFQTSNLILTAGLAGLIAQSFFANTLFYPPLLLWLVLISTVPKK